MLHVTTLELSPEDTTSLGSIGMRAHAHPDLVVSCFLCVGRRWLWLNQRRIYTRSVSCNGGMSTMEYQTHSTLDQCVRAYLWLIVEIVRNQTEFLRSCSRVV
jgi:hypothetical protein